jgi:predicted P-loop ATPase/GTPase
MTKCKCGRNKSFYAKICIKCKGISMRGNNNVSKKLEVRLKISRANKNRKKPFLTLRNKINNPAKLQKNRLRMINNNPAKRLEVREILKKNHATADTLTKHHIYLKENSDKIIITTYRKHKILHSRAYDYLVEIGLIDKYLIWFDKKYGLK